MCGVAALGSRFDSSTRKRSVDTRRRTAAEFGVLGQWRCSTNPVARVRATGFRYLSASKYHSSCPDPYCSSSLTNRRAAFLELRDLLDDQTRWVFNERLTERQAGTLKDLRRHRTRNASVGDSVRRAVTPRRPRVSMGKSFCGPIRISCTSSYRFSAFPIPPIQTKDR